MTKVLIVDDSAVVRGLISRMLDKGADIDVVGTVSNGELAIKRMKELEIDVVILDIEMPVMDGLTALPKILEVNPDVKVIMASTLTEKNADVSLKAMRAGAADYIPKPSTSRELTSADEFQRQLIEKVQTLGRAASKTVEAPGNAAKDNTREPAAVLTGAPIQLAKRPPVLPKPKILAVGSSTGGPQALFQFFEGMQGQLDVPVVVTQHMPPTFTTILAQHIERASGIPAKEAEDGDPLEDGKILVAPGDYHMTVVEQSDNHVVRLNQDPPENFCRPAVDPMLRSLIKIFGNKVLVVMLTGMGFDGLKGSKAIADEGGLIIAQDEASSVVWGMPGAVAEAGICSAVLPLSELAPKAASILNRGAL